MQVTSAWAWSQVPGSMRLATPSRPELTGGRRRVAKTSSRGATIPGSSPPHLVACILGVSEVGGAVGERGAMGIGVGDEGVTAIKGDVEPLADRRWWASRRLRWLRCE